MISYPFRRGDRTPSDREWFRLDNSANLYPAIRAHQIPMVFRAVATLKEPIHAEALQKALDRVIDRFPYYKVRLRAGFFWYFFERNDKRAFVRADDGTPCESLPDVKSSGYLFRVQAYKRRIAAEFFHALTDGSGGMAFLKTLIASYLELENHSVFEWGDLINPEEPPDPEEFEDAYHKYNPADAPKPVRLKPAFQLPFPVRNVFRYSYLIGECSAAALYELAKKNGVSVTEYLAGIYLYVLQQIYMDLPDHVKKRQKQILRIEIPVNLRRLYPSKSMRNFTLFVTPGIDLRLGYYTLREITQQVHHYMKMEVDTRRLNQQLARNVNPEHNAFLRGMPLVAKNSLLSSRYSRYGPKRFSGILTNLGRVNMPESIASEVESFSFITSPARVLKVNAAVATYRDKMRISFGSVTDATELEQRFFGTLTGEGIHVKVFRHEDV